MRTNPGIIGAFVVFYSRKLKARFAADSLKTKRDK